MSTHRNKPPQITEFDEEDTVARLLRAAGNRPSVPSEDAAIVRAAAHAEWQRTVTLERHRHRFWRTGGGLLAAAATAFLVLNSDLGSRLMRVLTQPAARVVAVTDAVSNHELGQALWRDDVIETAPATSATTPRLALRMADGALLRLDSGSRLRLHSRASAELESGTVYIDTQGSKLALETAWGTLTNLGTRYEVSVRPGEGSLRVRVREGSVQLADRQGEVRTLESGQELTLSASGPEVKDLSPCGPEWSWARDRRLWETPDEATRLHDALSWAAAEGGWQLRFASHALAIAQEGSITVHGDVAGLELEEIVALWVQSISLSHRIDGCVLRIE